MKVFGKLAKALRPEPQPRLLGHSEPYYSKKAFDAFAEALSAGYSILGPPLFRPPRASLVADLKHKTDVARLHCNPELVRLLLTYRDAVITYEDGRLDESEALRAYDDFLVGCRLALGTND